MIYPIPIRQEIEILPAPAAPKLHRYIIINSSGKCQLKRSRRLKLGWNVREEIGIAVVNPRALSKIVKTKDEI